MVSFKKIYMPDPQNRKEYEEKFAIFKQIYRQMKGIYSRLNR
jgi:hypothetical protein